jgi:hypothetical protein
MSAEGTGGTVFQAAGHTAKLDGVEFVSLLMRENERYLSKMNDLPLAHGDAETLATLLKMAFMNEMEGVRRSAQRLLEFGHQARTAVIEKNRRGGHTRLLARPESGVFAQYKLAGSR